MIRICPTCGLAWTDYAPETADTREPEQATTHNRENLRRAAAGEAGLHDCRAVPEAKEPTP